MAANTVGIDDDAAPGRPFTIGFTQKSARQFFTTLIDATVRRVSDVGLNSCRDEESPAEE